ncbi:hypothetical protein [Labrenzia sp. 011]|uniref:hypothetical protein n=1 Tax=Labrenzia sp. 011 TaxID=2171494 RepID=UPI0014021BE2|nr:hypothetical protein [Labrenzia sp. 011]
MTLANAFMENRSISTNAIVWPVSSWARPDIYLASLEGIISYYLLISVSFAISIYLSNKKRDNSKHSRNGHNSTCLSAQAGSPLESFSSRDAVFLTCSGVKVAALACPVA